ncbi:MAG: response regulator, partial [Pirellulales bacterium]
MPDGPVNVLLIEDDEDDFVLTKDLFAELPDGAYHLDRVADYPSALHALDHCDHHLYLVDYRLGSHTGLELVVEAIKRGCNKPMIMLTGQSEREFDLQAMRAGAVDYLIKDQLTAGMLERSMRYALRHSQQAEEIRQANQQLEQRVLERTEALGEANSALTESQRFLRSVLDALPIHIAVLDEAGAVLAVNAAWRRFADENEPPPGEDCIGQNFLEECLSERNPCGPHTELAQGIRYVLQGGLPGYQTEYPCHTPREHRWFQTQVSPFPRPGPVLAVVAREDTTSRGQSEQALRRQSRQLQELSRIATRFNVAHDVRSTLEILADAAQSIIGAHQCVSCQIADFDWSKAVCVSRISDKYLDWRDRDWPMGSGLERAICRGNHALRLTQDDAERHPAWLAPDYDGESRPPLRGLLAAPLVGHDGRNLGLVQLSDKFDGQEFTEEDAAILVQLAQMASVALENAFLYRD